MYIKYLFCLLTSVYKKHIQNQHDLFILFYLPAIPMFLALKFQLANWLYNEDFEACQMLVFHIDKHDTMLLLRFLFVFFIYDDGCFISVLPLYKGSPVCVAKLYNTSA